MVLVFVINVNIHIFRFNIFGSFLEVKNRARDVFDRGILCFCPHNIAVAVQCAALNMVFH